MADERQREEGDRPIDPRSWEESREGEHAPEEQETKVHEGSADDSERSRQDGGEDGGRDDGGRDDGGDEAREQESERGQASVKSEPDEQRKGGEYQWHTGEQRDHGSEDAIEFIDVVKAFGRNRVLNGLNLGIPDEQISMIIGPSGTGKSVCIKHMVGLLYPDEGDVLVHGDSVPNMAD